jgi:hypothetical protein
MEKYSKLQQELIEYDKDYWDFVDNDIIFNVHHIVGHLNKLMGKIGEYTDATDHGSDAETTKMINEVIPDLIQQALRLGYLFEVDAIEQHNKRLDSLREKYSSKKDAK